MAGLATGAVVLIQGLQARPELNGQAAKVVTFDRKSGRFEVELLGGTSKGSRVKPKAANLKPLSQGAPKRPSEIAAEAAAAAAAERAAEQEAEKAAKKPRLEGDASPTGENGEPQAALEGAAATKEAKPNLLAKLLSEDDGIKIIEPGAPFIAKMRTPVYKAADSWDMMKWLNPGDQVVASGPPVDAEGYKMLPLEPSGAVELEHLIRKKVGAVSKILSEHHRNPPKFTENWEKWKAEQQMRTDVYNELRGEFVVGDQYELGCGIALYGKEWGGSTTGSIPATTPSGRHQVIHIMEHSDSRMKVQGTYFDRETGKLVLAHWLVGWIDVAMACDKVSGELLIRKSSQDRAEKKQWVPRKREPEKKPEIEARAPKAAEGGEEKKPEEEKAKEEKPAPKKEEERDGEDAGPPRLEKVDKVDAEGY